MVKQRQPERVVVYQLKVRLTDIEPPQHRGTAPNHRSGAGFWLLVTKHSTGFT